jgi:hypothetical protein
LPTLQRLRVAWQSSAIGSMTAGPSAKRRSPPAGDFMARILSRYNAHGDLRDGCPADREMSEGTSQPAQRGWQSLRKHQPDEVG